MADLLDKASAWLNDQRAKYLSRMVTYQRGTKSVELAATIGRTVFEQTDEYGIVHKTESRDFLIGAADLVIDGVRVTPKAGDRIHENTDQQTLVYEVMAPGSEPPWKYCDSYRRTLRIHTKLIGTEET